MVLKASPIQFVKKERRGGMRGCGRRGQESGKKKGSKGRGCVARGRRSHSPFISGEQGKEKSEREKAARK